MDKQFQIVKLVTGNCGSKRMTIPKDVVKRLGLDNTDYVAVSCDENGKATIKPAEFVIKE